MNHIIFFVFLLLLHTPVNSCAQQQATKDLKVDPGGCEGCEAIYESPIPFEKLEPMVWLPD